MLISNFQHGNGHYLAALICSAVGIYIIMTFTTHIMKNNSYIKTDTMQRLFYDPNPTAATTRITTKIPRKPVFILGILSSDKHELRRKLQRETVLSHLNQVRVDIPYHVIYKFIMDTETKSSALEQHHYNDIVYLNTTIQGWAKKFGYKVQLWFKYVEEHFPDFSIAARMDDDVFLCVPQIFKRIFELQSPTLYYGWKHGGSNMKVCRIFNPLR